jgi:hypothetical protein
MNMVELAGGGPAAATQAAPEAPPRRELRCEGGWSLSRWLMLIALVFIAHLALIFVFGERKPVVPRAVTNVPELKLATDSEEWLALNNPTLFAQPNLAGFAGPALEPPHVEFHQIEWTEAPRPLPLPVTELGTTFSQFMLTNRFVTFQFELEPPLKLTTPASLLEPAIAKASTLRIEGDLARRQLLTPMKLPSWPYADVIAPSKVQVLVNAAGDIVSAVLLPSDNPAETDRVHDADADQRALELVRAAHFAPLPRVNVSVTANPAAHLTFGRLIFNWHTVALSATNAPTGS